MRVSICMSLKFHRGVGPLIEASVKPSIHPSIHPLIEASFNRDCIDSPPFPFDLPSLPIPPSFAQVWDRSVRLPDGSVAQFDVVGHKRSNRTFCIVVPFHSETKEVGRVERGGGLRP